MPDGEAPGHHLQVGFRPAGFDHLADQGEDLLLLRRLPVVRHPAEVVLVPGGVEQVHLQRGRRLGQGGGERLVGGRLVGRLQLRQPGVDGEAQVRREPAAGDGRRPGPPGRRRRPSGRPSGRSTDPRAKNPGASLSVAIAPAGVERPVGGRGRRRSRPGGRPRGRRRRSVTRARLSSGLAASIRRRSGQGVGRPAGPHQGVGQRVERPAPPPGSRSRSSAAAASASAGFPAATAVASGPAAGSGPVRGQFGRPPQVREPGRRPASRFRGFPGRRPNSPAVGGVPGRRVVGRLGPAFRPIRNRTTARARGHVGRPPRRVRRPATPRTSPSAGWPRPGRRRPRGHGLEPVEVRVVRRLAEQLAGTAAGRPARPAAGSPGRSSGPAGVAGPGRCLRRTGTATSASRNAGAERLVPAEFGRGSAGSTSATRAAGRGAVLARPRAVAVRRPGRPGRRGRPAPGAGPPAGPGGGPGRAVPVSAARASSPAAYAISPRRSTFHSRNGDRSPTAWRAARAAVVVPGLVLPERDAGRRRTPGAGSAGSPSCDRQPDGPVGGGLRRGGRGRAAGGHGGALRGNSRSIPTGGGRVGCASRLTVDDS